MQSKFISYLFTPEDPNLPDVTREEIGDAFKQACERDNLLTAVSLINRFPVLSDFSGDINRNPLYWAVCHDQPSIFEKLLSTSATQNFPVTQETLDNLFSIIKINIMNNQVKYFKLIYPYWQKQLSPENEQQERSRLADFIQENNIQYTNILKSIGYSVRDHGCSLLLAKKGMFSPNGQEVLPPELSKHIVNLAIQAEPGFR